MADSSDVRIFDTTLRDGEQSPGFSMTIPEKLRLAAQLDALGVDILEAGFPIASAADAEAVRAIASTVRRPIVAALARANDKDIDCAAHALAPASRPRIHTFIATSDLHLERKLRITREQCLATAVSSVRRARNFTTDVQFSAEDATRTRPRLPVPRRRGRDRRRRDDHQPARHGGVLDARGARGVLPLRHHPRSQRAQGRLQHPLPQRSRSCRGEQPGGRAWRRLPDRVHHQRHRRARGQRGARGSGDGLPRPPRSRRVPDRHPDAGAVRLQPDARAR